MVGSLIWEGCAALMVHLLTRAPSGIMTTAASLSGLSVLELGAGVGILGCLAAQLGAREVWITDRAEILHVIQRNIRANGVQSTAKGMELEWGAHDAAPATTTASALAAAPFDVILASDVLYNLSSSLLLLETLIEFSDSHTLILIAYRERDPAAEAVWFSRADSVFDIQMEEMHTRWKEAITFTPLAHVTSSSSIDTIDSTPAAGAAVSAAVKYAADTRPMRILRLQKRPQAKG